LVRGNIMRGSLWRRWDLHVHTPASFYHNFKIPNEEKERYNDNIWDKYIDELEKISEVSVLGITDYFSIEGYKKALDYKNEGRLENIGLILPNIEFRIEQVGNHNNKINYHVIFSNEVGVDVIEREFLQSLHIMSYEQTDPINLCRSNIEDIGNKVKAHNSEFTGTDYEVGCNSIFIDLKEIKRVLETKKSFFHGKYLLVLAERGWDTLKWIDQTSQLKRYMLFNSHAVFSSNERTVNWMLGSDYGEDEKFISEFNSLKPCIHGSDAHSFDDLCKPDEDKYCWIKADPTFEGLKTIIYEPHGRVKIQTENPNIRKNIYTLSSVKIDNSNINEDLSIQEGTLDLNENLVAITGGKGTGKTALLDLIANCFEDRCKRSKKDKDKNSFIQRIQKDKENLKVEIGFRGSKVENFSKKIIEDFPNSRITYLPQGKIEDFSSNKKLLAEKIEEIIFKNEKIVEKGCKKQFDDIKKEINTFVVEIEEINHEMHSLESEVTPEVLGKFESELKIKLGECENKKDELFEFKKSIKGSTSKIEELKETEKQLQLKSYKLNKVRSELRTLEEDLNKFLDSFEVVTNKINSELEEFEIDCSIPPLDCNLHFSHLEESFNLLDQEIECLESELKRIGEEHNQLNENEIEEAKIIEDLSNIKQYIEDLRFTLDSLKQKKTEIKILEGKRIHKYHDLLKKYLEWNKYYGKVINMFSEGKDEILNDISFESSIYFDENNFLKKGSEIFDFRKIRDTDLERLADILNEIITLNSDELRHDALLKFIEELKMINSSLKEKYDNYEFYRWAYGNYFSLRTEAFFKKRPMNKLSMGQKGTVLLKLFLAEGDYPLIIDQPEDNLDNKFIYNELVGAFKDAKKDRQIIIATNNANLVVNSDAEQVIVAEFEDNNIFYESGSLENPETRSKIMPILEGGEKAFREREEKYGI